MPVRKLGRTIAILCLLAGVFLGGTLSSAAQSDDDAPETVVERVVPGADFPVALAYTPDGRLFYTEKNTGQVRVINADGERQREPVISLPTDGFVERGLLGIAIDPDYEDNGHIWVYHTQPNTVEPPYPINRVVRFTEADGVGRDPVEMLAVPVDTREAHHMGGNLHFDADGYLFVSIGDIGEVDYAQDLNAMPGRIHRFAVEGDALVIPEDNPFPDNSTYAYGLRNPFDFDFDPFSGEIIGGENGPTCDDEINLILAGGKIR
ncbi:MAG: PQQ-dependent sugar dehydrogenase, partial [Anaerolineales bacterium]